MNTSKSEALFRARAKDDPGRRELAGARLPQRRRQPAVHRARRRLAPLRRRRQRVHRLRRLLGTAAAGPPPSRDHRGARSRRSTIGTSFGAPTEREVELAEAISRRGAVDRDGAPGELRHRGDDVARIRLARGFTGRDLTVKFEGCYHGHVDSLLVKAGSGMATLGIADTQGVPKAFCDTTHRAAVQFAGGAGSRRSARTASRSRR